MLLFMLILGQALGLPEVEKPIPDKIGLATIFAVAGAGGVLGGVARFRSPSAERERGAMWGIFLGFCGGATAYFLLMFLQLLSAL
ncbi:MAG TPA: hypothetical protein VFI17_04300 [Solirubrobacterales bacterium]|nr:hypothetical protein [Solirubrobacterales bacterium]